MARTSNRGGISINGKIVNLDMVNIEVIAKIIYDIIGGDLFRIDTKKPYPIDYTETTEVAKHELKSNTRPVLTDHVSDMDLYKIIFLGYPNWWGTMPMVVHTFLESYDFSGKTIIPFCTHEGSGLGSTVRNIEKLCPKAELINAIAFHRGSRKMDKSNKLNESVSLFFKIVRH